jgi:hypothetical protein
MNWVVEFENDFELKLDALPQEIQDCIFALIQPIAVLPIISIVFPENPTNGIHTTSKNRSAFARTPSQDQSYGRCLD